MRLTRLTIETWFYKHREALKFYFGVVVGIVIGKIL